MRKTPSYLKGLAETRARVSADVARYQRLHDELSRKLAEATAELEACDRLIRKYDARLDPSQIAPIRAWKGRYGKRGQLIATIKQILAERAPSEVTTMEVMCELQLRLGISFETAYDRKRWRCDSVLRRLKELCAEGLAERLHSPEPTGETGRWRWATPVDGLEGLSRLAAQVGAPVGTAISEPATDPAEASTEDDDLPC